MFFFGSTKLLKREEWSRADIDQDSARNLRQRLSPKANPWDSDNMDQERR